MASILKLPSELILVILSACESFSQVIALSSACKRIYTVWETNQPSIIWSAGKARIPAFNDALMTARATRIVMEHCAKGELPPDPFPFHLLSGRNVKPTVDDVKAVFDFEHLIKYIETIFLSNSQWRPFNIDRMPDPAAAWSLWREGYHRSMYRVFLSGAVLCRAYQEPLSLPHPDRPSDFLRGLKRKGARPRMWDEEVRYLAQYPVFNFEAYEKHESIYGAFAEFLVQEARSVAAHSPPKASFIPPCAKPSGLHNGAANVLFLETLQTLFAFLQFDGYESDICIFDDGEDSDDPDDPFDPESPTKTVTAILLGRFSLEQICMPGDINEASSRFLTREHIIPPSSSHDPNMNPYSPSLRTILATLMIRSGQPNHYGTGNRTPAPPLQLFQFIYRRFLGLRFAKEVFQGGFPRTSTTFTRSGDLLLEDPDFWPEIASRMFDSVEGDYSVYYKRYI